MQIETTRKRFTVDDYHRMAETGILSENDRTELIEGEIIQMSPIGDPHFNAVNRATMIFARGIGDRVVVSVQNPAVMDRHNEPQPDVVLIRPREGFYGSGKPDPEDVVLLIEISDTSLRFDQEVKLPVYARNGVREVWIVDLQDEVIRVHREPKGKTYTSIEIKQRNEQISPQAFPDFSVNVSDLIG
jgi:Uma2 family endonuclease